MNNFKNNFDNIKFSDEEKEQLTDKIFEAVQNEKFVTKKKIIPLKFILVAIIITLCISGGGYAAIKFENIIQSKIKGSDTAISQFSEKVSKLGIVQTWNGWTLTITDIAGDSENIMIGFEIKSPENIKFYKDRHYSFSSIDISVEDTSLIGWGSNGDNIDVVDEHTLTGMTSANNLLGEKGESFEGKTAKIKFKGLYDTIIENAGTKDYKRYEITEDFKEISKHKWVFDNVPLDFENTAITMQPNKEVNIYGGKATLTDISISPISVTVRVEGGSCENHHFRPVSHIEAYSDLPTEWVSSGKLEGSEYNDFCDYDLTVNVVMKDGSFVDFSSRKANCEDEKDIAYMERILKSDEIIDLNNIDYIEVCDEKFYIE